MCGNKGKYMHFWIGRGIFGWVITSAVLMWLWNTLVPDLFHGPFIGFFQAMGLLLLGRLISGRRRMHAYRHHHGKQGETHTWASDSCRSGWREKFEAKMKEKMAEPEAQAPAPDPKSAAQDVEKDQFKKGFQKGPWDVNIVDVEDEDKTDDAPDSPDKKA